MKYSQPDFYHFSRLSIALSKFAAQSFLKSSSRNHIRVLDMCAGSGVIGIEFVKSLSEKITIQELVFCEKNQLFKRSIEQNCQHIENSLCQTKVIINAGEELVSQFRESFDLVLMNPPFYIVGEGREKQSHDARACHQFETEYELSNLLLSVVQMLNINGVAYLVFNRHSKKVMKQLQDMPFKWTEQALLNHEEVTRKTANIFITLTRRDSFVEAKVKLADL
jgi:tRNA1(Val) A37 N6-methylase TrmN6